MTFRFRESWERKDFILPASRVDVGKEKGMHVELPTQIPWTGMGKFSSDGGLILSPIL